VRQCRDEIRVNPLELSQKGENSKGTVGKKKGDSARKILLADYQLKRAPRRLGKEKEESMLANRLRSSKKRKGKKRNNPRQKRPIGWKCFSATTACGLDAHPPWVRRQPKKERDAAHENRYHQKKPGLSGDNSRHDHGRAAGDSVQDRFAKACETGKEGMGDRLNSLGKTKASTFH